MCTLSSLLLSGLCHLLVMEVVASSAEYATELAKLEEEFSRYKWSHAPSILATLLKETSTKDHFLQVVNVFFNTCPPTPP